MDKIYNITILGGTDGFGKWLTQFILKEFSSYTSVTITGRDLKKGKRISDELGVEFTHDNLVAVRDADIVIYSTPISQTEKIIQETLPYIKSGAVVSDVTSIKGFPSRAMQVRDDIIAIPTHPMFGPYISSIAGQVVVLTPNKSSKSTSEYVFFKEFLESQHAKVIESTTKYHDKMMAVVQGLTHLNMFVIGETMKRLDFDISESMDFISPIYKLMASSVGRYLGQNPGLYADIQMYNDEVLDVHEKFLETAHSFNNSVKDKDYDTFCSDIVEARKFLGESNCNQGQQYTDKVIYMQGQQIDMLQNNVGKNIGLKDIYSGEYIEGKLESYGDGNIFFPGGDIYRIDRYEVIVL